MIKKNIDLNKLISKLLAIGIYLTVFFYVFGILLLLIKNHGTVLPEKATFKGISGFFESLFTLHAEPFFYLGTVTLIFTPITRVLFSIYLFYLNGEKKYIFVTSIVAVILLISIVLGLTFSIKLG